MNHWVTGEKHLLANQMVALHKLLHRKFSQAMVHAVFIWKLVTWHPPQESGEQQGAGWPDRADAELAACTAGIEAATRALTLGTPGTAGAFIVSLCK